MAFSNFSGSCTVQVTSVVLDLSKLPQKTSQTILLYATKGGGSSGAFGAGNPSPGGIVGNQYLSEDVFLLLQSVVMAVQVLNSSKIIFPLKNCLSVSFRLKQNLR